MKVCKGFYIYLRLLLILSFAVLFITLPSCDIGSRGDDTSAAAVTTTELPPSVAVTTTEVPSTTMRVTEAPPAAQVKTAEAPPPATVTTTETPPAVAVTTTEALPTTMRVTETPTAAAPTTTEAPTAAAPTTTEVPTAAAPTTTEAPPPAPDIFEIAYISDFGLLGDSSINQATWDGIMRFVSGRGLAAACYYPANQSVGAYLEAFGWAVENGAKLVVTSGVLCETPVWEAQRIYPDTSFILIDGLPHDGDYDNETIYTNVAAVRFSSCEAGFLAGYAAVKSGSLSLGFIGAMPTPEIADTGLGFIQGAEYAAGELQLPDCSIHIKYTYAGTFMARPEIQALAMEWYGASTAGDANDTGETAGGWAQVDLIYAAGGEAELRVEIAASLSGKPAILYENYGMALSPSIVAAVEKNYADAVYDCILKYYSNGFPGGEILIYGAAEGGVGLNFPGDKPLIPLNDYIRTVSALASGAIEVVSAYKRPYAPPEPGMLATRAVVVDIAA